VTVQEFIKGQLAWLAWSEAHHIGGIDGPIAIALMVRNRVRAGWLGGDWGAVISMHHSYSADSNLVAHGAHLLMECRDRDFLSFLQKIDDIFSGQLQDTYTGGGLYCCDLNMVRREWFKENILAHLDQHPRVASVASLTFFS
jgi:hypothetical protein